MGDSVRLLADIGLYQWTRILLMGDSVRLLDDIGLYQWDQDSSHGGFCEITG